MALTVSEQMQRRKQQKFRRELERDLSRFSSTNLAAYLERTFGFHTERPNAQDFVEMAMASKFGVGNCLSQGGVGFFLETCLIVFNRLFEHQVLKDKKPEPWGAYYKALTDISDLWNATFLFDIDAKLYPHVSQVRLDDLIWADDISPYLFLDGRTRAFGFVIVPLPAMSLEDFIDYGQPYIHDWDAEVRRTFDNGRAARLKLVEFDTGPMNYISAAIVIFGTVDKLVHSLPDRARHQVSSHPRKLASGNTTVVRSYNRRTPLRLVVNNRSLTDHIVYAVRDHAGFVRYFGEGKSDRWQHVNSGASHNWKINEHFFTKGPLDVQILQRGLTKSEALSIEKLLIRGHSGSDLWNVKDYEPFVPEAEPGITDEEIQKFLSE